MHMPPDCSVRDLSRASVAKAYCAVLHSMAAGDLAWAFQTDDISQLLALTLPMAACLCV